MIGVAGGAGIPWSGDGAGGAGWVGTPGCCWEPANSRVYSLGPCAVGGAAGATGGGGGPAAGADGVLNSLVYSPGPCWGGGTGGVLGANGLEKMLSTPPIDEGGVAPESMEPAGRTPGADGVPNRRVKAPGSCGGGACGTGAGRFRSSPPGRDSGSGDWKNRVNSPDAAEGASEEAGRDEIGAGGGGGDTSGFWGVPGGAGGA